MHSVVYERTVRLGAEPEIVFWDLLEPGNVPDYDSRMRSWVPRSFPPSVGTVVDFEAKLGPLWSKGMSEFTAFDPPHHLEVQLVKPKTPLHSTLAWFLSSAEPGTEFTYRFESRTPRGMKWLGEWLVRSATGHLDVELPALANRYE
ncbi:MAG: hypothetical protein PVF87_06945 [Acidimicrobiia bacterium]